jgi:ABC-type antimicrobial peptide transport system permease subunit
MYGISTERNTKLLLAVFFLVNLVLGVIGSFYLQTRRRVTEMGVHRSFGASRRNIIAILMGEGFALTTVSFIIGDLLYLQYALKYGLDTGFGNNIMYNIINNWVTNFNEHFAIISAVVYVILMACVAIGVYLPARSVSRINPVDALRNK